jgi:hypothetical protein
LKSEILRPEPLAAQDYVIDYARKSAPNLPRHKTVKIVDERSFSRILDNQPAQTKVERITIELQADIETLSREKGTPTKLKILITQLKCDQNGRPIELVPIGSALIAENKNHLTVFSYINGDRISDDIQNLLRMAISISEDSNADDKAFGTKERKKVGDTWDINRNFAVSKLKQFGWQVDPEKIAGSCTLREIVKDQGIDCMRININMEMHDVNALQIPADVKLTKLTLNCNMSGLFPVDISKKIQQSSQQLNAEVIASGKVPSGDSMIDSILMIRMTRFMEFSWTPVTKSAHQ